MKLKKLFLAPIFILFATPWIQKLVFLNLQIALTHLNLSVDQTQDYTIFLMIVAPIVTFVAVMISLELE